MKTAKFIKQITNFRGDARLYRLSRPLSKYKFVIVSAIKPNNVAYDYETFIFGSNENGEVTNWLELSGSFTGEMNHEKALKNAGYIIKE